MCSDNIAAVSSQAIFTLLDQLKEWVHAETKERDSEQGSKFVVSKSTEVMQKFIQSIPAKSLTQAAIRCRAYARALMYLETELQERHATDCKKGLDMRFTKHLGKTINIQEISQLQLIYSNIDEPEGFYGFYTIRRESTLEKK